MKKTYVFLVLAIIFSVILLGGQTKTEKYSSGELMLPEIFQKNETSHFARASRDKKILFVGDMMFDRYIRKMADEKGEDFIFSCIKDFLKEFDLVIGNLEGPITDNPSVSMGTEIGSPENYIFTFPPSTAKLLAKNNIKLVSLGNNHTGNFGNEGILSTKNYLDEAGINYFDKYTIYRTKYEDANISFISYNEFALPAEALAKAGGELLEEISQKIKNEKAEGRIVFVYAHWGDEYISPLERIKNLARSFVDAGADFIIGSHPHIILPSEKITLPQPSPYAKEREAVIYYSLGNFIFDQYWNEDVSTGLVLGLNIRSANNKPRITTNEYRVSLLPDGRTCLIN